jgi:S1-C subfamily serine protease
MDVLLGLDGQPPVRAIDVYRRIRALSPGATVRLRILRDGRRLVVPVVLGTRPKA